MALPAVGQQINGNSTNASHDLRIEFCQLWRQVIEEMEQIPSPRIMKTDNVRVLTDDELHIRNAFKWASEKLSEFQETHPEFRIEKQVYLK